MLALNTTATFGVLEFRMSGFSGFGFTAFRVSDFMVYGVQGLRMFQVSRPTQHRKLIMRLLTQNHPASTRFRLSLLGTLLSPYRSPYRSL